MDTREVRIKMLGIPEITIGGAAVKLPFRQADALIYYLAVNGSASRTKLCDLLWGNKCTDEKAKSNLRNTVYIIRKELGSDFIVEPARQMVALNWERPITADVAARLEAGPEVEEWQDFLCDFYLKDNDLFNDWASAAARELKEKFCERVRGEMRAAYQAADFSRCRALCKTLIGADKYDESAYRCLMLIHRDKKEYARAAGVYDGLRKLLREELSQEPEEETARVLRTIKERQNRERSQDVGRGPAPDGGLRSRFFYGREAEVRRISRTLASFMRRGVAASILVSGEMGIGKTALMEEAASTAASGEAVLAVACCYQTDGTFLLKPWYGIFEQLLRSIPDDCAPEAQYLKRAVSALFPRLDSVVSPTYEPFSAEREYFLVRALVEYCTNNRLVILVDDIQWADPASLALVRNVITMDKNRTILFIMGCRNDHNPDIDRLTGDLKLSGLLEECQLPRFTSAQTFDFAKKFLPPDELAPDFERTLFRETEGNPLFIVETLNNIRFNGSLSGFTARLGDIIRQRILSVESKALKTLELIAMTPDGTTFETLRHISQERAEELIATIEYLLVRKLIREDASSGEVVFRFTHQKIMEYTYEQIPLIRKRLLHKEIALYLESLLPEQAHGAFVFPKLIYHFERARQMNKYLEYVIKNIIGYLNVAQEYFPLGGNAERPLIFSGVSLLELNDIEGYFLSVEQKITEEPKLFRGPEGERLLSEFYALQARHYTHNIDYPRGLACIAKLKQLNERCENQDQRRYILKANYHRSSICMDRMEIGELLRVSDESLRLACDEESRATWLRISGMSQAFAGNYANALQRLHEAAALFLSFNDAAAYRYAICACYAWIGEAHRNSFDFDEADAWHERALGLCQEEARGGAALFYTLYAQALADRALTGERRGNDRLCRALREARRLFGKFRLCWYRGVAYAYSSLCAFEAGSYSEAAGYLAEAQSSANLLESDYEKCVVNRVSAQIKRRVVRDGLGAADFAAVIPEPFSFYKEAALRITRTLNLPVETAYLARM